MGSFGDVLENLVREGDFFVIDAPEDWAQGRTLYGGMTASLAYESVRRGLSDLPPLRSAQFTFIGPASGRLRFDVSLLRRGRSSALVEVNCANAEGVAARAVLVFGAARESKVAHDYLPMPKVDAPDAIPSFRKEGGPRGFWNNYETRLAAGGRILDTNAPRPEFTVWTRFLNAGDADPMTALIAAADCLPPAAMVHFPAPDQYDDVDCRCAQSAAARRPVGAAAFVERACGRGLFDAEHGDVERRWRAACGWASDGCDFRVRPISEIGQGDV